jgi:hypothetical protein
MNFRSSLFTAIFIASFGVGVGVSAQDFNLIPVQAMDPKTGIPIFSISLPPGWAYTADSIWDYNIGYTMSAKSPDGIETFTILPDQRMNAPMTPSQFGRFFIGQLQKTNPQFAALNYRIVEVWDYPVAPEEQAEMAHLSQMTGISMRQARGMIKGEYTENGIPKIEWLWIKTIFGGGTGTAVLVGMNGRKGNDDVLEKKLVAIYGSMQENPQWVQRANAARQQNFAAESQREAAKTAGLKARMDANQAQQQEINRVQAQIRGTQREVANIHSNTLGRTSDMTVDTVRGEDNRTNPHTGQTFKSDVNTGHVWVNEHGQRIDTNDSTYNPNHDSRVSGDWRQAPKGY